MKSTARATVQGYALTILSAVCFGAQPLMASWVCAYGISAKMLALLRVMCVIPVFLIAGLLKKESFRINMTQFLKILVLSVSGAVLTTLFLFSSYTCIDSATATTLNFSYPVFVLLLGIFVYKEKVRRATLISIVVCVIGVIFFCNPSGNFTWRGFFLALASGLTYGIYVLYMEKSRIMETMGLYSYTFWFFLLSTLILFPIVGAYGELNLNFPAKAWLFSVLFAFGGGVFATLFLQIGVRCIGSRKASILAAMEPVTSMILGVLFLQETIRWSGLVGIILVISSTVILVLGEKKPSVDPADSEAPI